MEEFKLPTADNRMLLVRLCTEGRAVQLGIVGKRGSLVEAVPLDATQLPGLLGILGELSDQIEAELQAREAAADRNLLDRLSEAEAAVNRTHCEHGHELTPENSYRLGNGKGCRQCRREANHYWRKENGK